MNEIFNICCEITRITGNIFGLSYGEINVLLFLRIQPFIYLISNFIILLLSIVLLFKKKYSYIKSILTILPILFMSFLYFIGCCVVYPISTEGFDGAVYDLMGCVGKDVYDYMVLNICWFGIYFIISMLIKAIWLRQIYKSLASLKQEK